MVEEKTRRLKQVATTLNIGTATIVDYLSAKGFEVENRPTTKITAEQFNMLEKQFAFSMKDKIEAEELNIGKKPQSNQIAGSERNCKDRKPSKSKEQSIAKGVKGLACLIDEEVLRHIYALDGGRYTPPKVKSHRIKEVAGALDTTVPILIEVLKRQGHNVDSNPNTKLSEDQFRLISDHFAAKLEVATEQPSILKHLISVFFEEVDFDCYREASIVNIDDELLQILAESAARYRMDRLRFKIIEKRKRKQKQFDYKARIQSIITPKLFHVFAGEEDHRDAYYNEEGFSTVFNMHDGEACLNNFFFKTGFLNEKLTTT